MAALIPFLRGGLARGERCVYIADRDAVEQMAATTTARLGVRLERDRGPLIVMSGREYRQPGRSDPGVMLKLIQGMGARRWPPASPACGSSSR